MAKNSISEFIRGKIREMKEKVREKGEYREMWSVRDLWYWMKPFLAANENITVETPKWADQRSKLLSSVLSQMVLGGELRYRDILVEDMDREVSLRVWAQDFKDVIVFIEKNGVYEKVKSVAELFDISIISGKGFIPTSTIEKVMDRLETDRHYKVVVMTDYDPYGAFIVEDFASRATQLGMDMEVIRAGLGLDQIPAEHVEVVKYPVSKGNLAKEFYEDWVAANPLDNFGLELQCFAAFVDNDAEALREVLVDCLLEHCPETIMYDRLLEYAIEGAEGSVIEQLVEDDPAIEKLRAKIKELETQIEELGEVIDSVMTPIAKDEFSKIPDNRSIPAGTLRRRAIKGYTSLNHWDHTSAKKMKDALFEKLKEIRDEYNSDYDKIADAHDVDSED